MTRKTLLGASERAELCEKQCDLTKIAWVHGLDTPARLCYLVLELLQGINAFLRTEGNDRGRTRGQRLQFRLTFGRVNTIFAGFAVQPQTLCT